MISPTVERIQLAPGFWSSLRRLGIEARDIARQAQLPTSLIQQPSFTIEPYFAIWQAYSDLIGDVGTAIVKLATAFETAHYPPSALSTFHARDFREALTRMSRYKQLCPPENLRITEEGDCCTIELDGRHAEQSGPPVLLGTTLAYLIELGRRGTGQSLTAQRVEFSFSLDSTQALETFFGCRIRTGADGNRLKLHRRDLDRPFVSYNAELLEMLTPALDRALDEHLRSRSLCEAVKQLQKRNLVGGRPDIRIVASELGMSDRTLQRRLRDEGTSFKHLLAQARHEQALSYLADPSLDIKEIAFLVGYEDQNSFYRAFRLWERDTPTNWRVRHEVWRSELVTGPV